MQLKYFLDKDLRRETVFSEGIKTTRKNQRPGSLFEAKKFETESLSTIFEKKFVEMAIKKGSEF